MDWPGCTAKGAVEASPPLGAQSVRKTNIKNNIRSASVAQAHEGVKRKRRGGLLVFIIDPG
jgi:hypothetical protein